MPLDYIPSDASTTLRGLVNLTTQSFAGAKTFTGSLVASGGISSNSFTVATSGKVTFVASATGASSLNIPSGTAPTSPSSGDMWYDGTNLYFRNGGSSVNLLSNSGITGSGTSSQVAYFSGGTSLTSSANFTFSGSALAIAGSLTITTAKTTVAAAATGYASLNLPSGTAPTSPVSGDVWWDGTNLYFYNGSSNVNLLGFGTGTVSGTGTSGQLAIWSATSVLTGSSAFTVSGTAITFSGAGGVTVTNAKSIFAAATTSYAAINLPSGTAPTAPTTGDIWSTGTAILFYNGSANKTIAFTDFSNISGTLTVSNGGTGQASFASTNSLLVSGSSSTGAFATVTGASGLLYGTAANTAPTFTTSIGAAITFTAGITVTTSGITDTINALATTSTLGFALQNTTASTSGATQQQSPGFDFIGHAWNTTATAADNFVRLRQELQVASAATPTGTFVWKTSVDTGTASFTNRMTLTTAGLLTVSNGLTITSGTFTIGSNTLALSSSSTLSTNSQSLILAASTGNITFAAGSGSSATQHNFVQSGTTQYVLESATAPTALGDMYYASTSSYATMTKLSIGVRGATLVASGATPTPTWLSPSSTSGIAIVSGGTGADLAYGTVVVAGGGTGQTTFASTNSLLVSGSSSTGAFATVTGASGLLYGTAANTAPTFTTSIGAAISFTAGITVSSGVTVSTGKVAFAASTTSAPSANIPSGTAPTSPAAGDTWYDGTYLYFKDNVSGYTKRLNKRICVVVIVTSFTPTSGADTAEIPIPWHGDGSSSITWNVRRIDFRVQTAGGTPSVTVEKSTSGTGFSAATIGTVTLTTGAYEGNTVSGFTNSTVASGDKVRINVGTVATALNWTVTLTLEES